MAAALYSYIGLSGEVVVIDTSNLVFTGAWSNSTSYAVKDVVDYNLRKFICVAAHTGVTPPSLFTTVIPEYWSPLVLVEGGTDDGMTADELYSLAYLALQTAWAGTATADHALQVALTGTTAADQAYVLGSSALVTAWAGTTAATGAQSAANSAYSLAQQALDAAWAGTNLPTSSDKLPLAGGVMTGTMTVPNVQVGYGTLPTSSMSNGTQYYDFVGNAYQETTVDKDMFISAQNMGAGREITVVLRNNGTSHALAYSGSFEWFGSAPPATITTKDVVIAFTSSGNTLGGVLAAAQTAI